jgi:hypothetical protein
MTDLGSARPSVEASGAARASDRETTARGWTHLLLGVLILVSGVGVPSGNVAARGGRRPRDLRADGPRRRAARLQPMT